MDSFENVLYIGRIMGAGLSFRADGFRLVYAIITTVMWICSTLLSREYFEGTEHRMRYRIFSLLTYLATMGVFLSGDLYTTFCFFEIMSLTSYVLVVQTEKPDAMRAGGTYLAVAVIGGLVMLMGLFMLNDLTGTLNMSEVGSLARNILVNGTTHDKRDLYIAAGLILFGFGAKAGMFPLHIWLPKAHPAAPAPASALLSGVLTKSGLFGVLVLTMEIFRECPGFGLTVYILGVITMLTGAVLAVFSIDLKRTLACSSVSQIGFILVGVGLIPQLGEECTLAAAGSVLYMFNHSMFKLCLFLAAGSVYMKCHRLDLNDIRGAGREMRPLKYLFLIGALGISGVPLFSGYISKTLIHEAIVEMAGEGGALSAFFSITEWLFLISGGMTASYMTKLYIAVFVDKPSKRGRELGIPHDTHFSPISVAAVAVPAVVITVMGLLPGLFIGRIGRLMTSFNTFSLNGGQLEHLDGIRIFSLENLKGSCISLCLGAVFYLLIRRFLTRRDEEGGTEYLNRWPSGLDIEELIYRPLLLKLLPGAFGAFFTFIGNVLPRIIWHGLIKAGSCLAAFTASLPGRARYCMTAVRRTASIVAELPQRFIDMMQRYVFSTLKTSRHPKLRKLYLKYSAIERSDRIIASTLSFGMLIIAIGLCFTIFYLFYLLFA